MHEFGILNMGHYVVRWLNFFFTLVYILGLEHKYINEIVHPPVDGETLTNCSAILFVSLGEVEFIQYLL